MMASSREQRTRLTRADFLSIFAMDPETGGLTWKVERRVGRGKGRLMRIAGDPAGFMGSNGYQMISVGRERFPAHRIVWLIVHGDWPGGEIDHINGVRDDNRPCNLRVATGNQNRANTPSRAKSGLKGVTRPKQTTRYVAQITVDGKNCYLGCFKTAEDAHAAYSVAARAAFGEFARVS